MEYIDVTDRADARDSGSGLSLAQKLAKLHTTPAPTPEGHSQPMFGWPTSTYCGSTKQDNTFHASWPKYYSENRLMAILRRIDEHHGSDLDLRLGVEAVVEKVVPRLLGNGHLGGRRGVMPVLVHGDLWIGNRVRGRIATWSGPEEFVYDPSVCHAHSEYEIGIMRMFGGFSAGFFHEYHRLVPKTEPKEEYEDRVRLYQLCVSRTGPRFQELT
jgi:fructosamine-3-kinase